MMITLHIFRDKYNIGQWTVTTLIGACRFQASFDGPVNKAIAECKTLIKETYQYEKIYWHYALH